MISNYIPTGVLEVYIGCRDNTYACVESNDSSGFAVVIATLDCISCWDAAEVEKTCCINSLTADE